MRKEFLMDIPIRKHTVFTSVFLICWPYLSAYGRGREFCFTHTLSVPTKSKVAEASDFFHTVKAETLSSSHRRGFLMLNGKIF